MGYRKPQRTPGDHDTGPLVQHASNLPLAWMYKLIDLKRGDLWVSDNWRGSRAVEHNTKVERTLTLRTISTSFPVLIFSVRVVFFLLYTLTLQVLRPCECHELSTTVFFWPTFRKLWKI